MYITLKTIDNIEDIENSFFSKETSTSDQTCYYNSMNPEQEKRIRRQLFEDEVRDIFNDLKQAKAIMPKGKIYYSKSCINDLICLKIVIREHSDITLYESLLKDIVDDIMEMSAAVHAVH